MRRLGDLIGASEGDYDSFNRGVAGDAKGAKIDFSEMTVAEIQNLQVLSKGDPNKLFAVGKYQIITGTMDEVVTGMELRGDERYTPELQEEMLLYLISKKRPNVKNYITGQIDDLHAATLSAAKEWASIENPNDPGFSVYKGTGGNKAHISVDEVQAALNVERVLYQEHIQNGLPPEAAFAALNLRPSPQALVARFDMQIEHKYTQIDKLGEQLETTTDAKQRQQIEGFIDSKHLEIAQLELDKIELIDNKISELMDKKEEISHQLEAQATQLQALDRVESTLSGLNADPQPYSQIKDDLDAVDISILSPHKTALSNKTNLDLTNISDIKILQRVLIEDDFLNASATGNFASKTKQALRDALDKPADHEFDTSVPLDQSTLDQIVKAPESFTQAEISQAITDQKTELENSQDKIEKQISRIDETVFDLASQKTTVVEQKIQSEQTKINDIHQQINGYDQTHIEPFNRIQQNLQGYQTQDHQNSPNANTSAYESVKTDLESQSISVLSPRQQDFYDNPRFDANSSWDVNYLQQFLVQEKHLDAADATGTWNEQSKAAVEAYQATKQGLTVDGDPGKNTKAKIKEDVLNNLPSDVIAQKVATAQQIAMEHKSLDITEMNAQIESHQTTINELNTQQQQLLSNQNQLRPQETTETEVDPTLGSYEFTPPEGLMIPMYQPTMVSMADNYTDIAIDQALSQADNILNSAEKTAAEHSTLSSNHPTNIMTDNANGMAPYLQAVEQQRQRKLKEQTQEITTVDITANNNPSEILSHSSSASERSDNLQKNQNDSTSSHSLYADVDMGDYEDYFEEEVKRQNNLELSSIKKDDGFGLG